MNNLSAFRPLPASVAMQAAAVLTALCLVPAVLGALSLEARTDLTPWVLGAVAFDLVFGACGVGWWARRHVEPSRLIGTAALGLGLAALLMPAARPALGVAALLVAGGALWRRAAPVPPEPAPWPLARRAARLGRVLPLPLSMWVAHETLLWPGLWRRGAHAPPGAEALTSFRRSGRVAYVWLYVFSELPLHLGLHAILVPDGRAFAAWALTAADLGFSLFLFALAASYRRFPTFVAGDTLVLHQGLLWSGTVPLADIAQVTAPVPGGTRLTLSTPPNLALHLTREAQLRGPYGLRRRGQVLTVFMDDPAAFRAALGR